MTWIQSAGKRKKAKREESGEKGSKGSERRDRREASVKKERYVQAAQTPNSASIA